jgi:hypothetical protein
MKKNKYIGILMLAATMLTATSCSDYNDYNSAPSAGDLPGANSTLWENISSDTQLTKFANLAKKCNFSEVLNSPRFYTVWAPIDNVISDAEYNRLMGSDSATIVKQFMQQHMTEYNYPVSAALDSTTIISLNAKHHTFTQNGFDGFSYNATNLPSTNGVMHKINGLSEFHKNLYENIDDIDGCDAIKDYIQKYDEYYIDVNASVIGPLRDGKQTYLDSVMKKRNNVITRIMAADLENEDSTYCMFLPNDKAWQDAYDAITPYYNYIPKLDYMDLSKKTLEATSTMSPTHGKAEKPAETDSELQDSLTCHNLVSNLVFSNWYQGNKALFKGDSFAAKDSTRTTSGCFLTNMQEALNHATATNEMSNGLTYTVDSLTFYPWETYNPDLSYTKPEATMRVKKTTTHNIALDSLKGRDSLFSKLPQVIREKILPAKARFFTYEAVDSADIEGSSAKPEFDYALKDVRSGTYCIYVVTVPAQVEDPEAAVKPYYLRFLLSWTDAANKQQLSILPVDEKGKSANKDIEMTTDFGKNSNKLVCIGDPGRVNVFDLGEFTFPACYYGTDAYPSLIMIHTKGFGSTANRKKYDQPLRIAGVYLIPKEMKQAYDQWANSVNE